MMEMDAKEESERKPVGWLLLTEVGLGYTNHLSKAKIDS